MSKGNKTASDVFIHHATKEVRGEKLKIFLEEYVENGGDHLAAAKTAGYANPKQAKKLLRDNWEAVQDLVMNKIGGHVPFAIEGIVRLAQNAKNESVRLKACQDLLGRAGYDQAIKIESKVVDATEMEDGALENELLELLKKANLPEGSVNIEGIH